MDGIQTYGSVYDFKMLVFHEQAAHASTNLRVTGQYFRKQKARHETTPRVTLI